MRDGKILALHVAEFMEALPQCLVMRVRRQRPEKSYPRDFLGLLRLGYHSNSKQNHCNKD